MIQVGSFLSVADNSGGKKVLCIRVLRSKSCGRIGDVVVVSIKKAIPNSKVKEGDVYKAVVVRTRSVVRRSGGHSISFGDNAVVILNNSYEMIGRRVFGSVGRELRGGGFARVVSLAKEVL